MPPATSSPMNAHPMTADRVGSELLRLLDELPQSKQMELLNFARFLHRQTLGVEETEEGVAKLRPVLADTLVHLTGVLALGGDALRDTEALYDGG